MKRDFQQAAKHGFRTLARALVAGLLATGLMAGCEKPASTLPAAKEEAGGATNRVDIPDMVRQNLGITFAKVEKRVVSRTLRAPGAFELLPEARREYRAPAGGRVELAVQQFEAVEAGDVLCRIDSPRWREVQEQLAQAEASVAQAEARLASMEPLRGAHREHERSLTLRVELWMQRLKRLEMIREAGGGSSREWTEAQASLNAAQAELADVMEKDAELAARDLETQADVRSALARRALLLEAAASLSGIGRDGLVELDEAGQPRWRTLAQIEVRAVSPGVVETLSLTNGGLVEATGMLLTTLRPEQVRFRARTLQGDLARLREGLPAAIVPPGAGVAGIQASIPASLRLGLTAGAEDRTIDLIAQPAGDTLPAWARAGVAAYLEITLEGGNEELAVPAACVVRDGATPILFRRDPANADKVIRITADTGTSDGRWIVIQSGVREGDEIVLGGAYPLLLATSGSMQRGGHFHSDGTFHADDH
ncbi:MAG: hypothetical protein HUU18_06850 [Phycisphaerales bacterium]|nr:hypothetical protein [Phycisphaerales bacterium]